MDIPFGSLRPVAKNSTSRLATIDAMRGVAISAVLLGHCLERANIEWFITFNHFFNLAHFGVIVFFLVSGFIIPTSLRHGIRRFWARRFWRLYPMFWLSIIIAILCKSTEAIPNVFNIVANITMAPLLVGAPYIIGVYWSLQVELLFYICLTFALLYNRSLQPIQTWGIAATVAVSIEIIGPHLIGYKPPFYSLYLTFMFVGVVLHAAFEGTIRWRSVWGVVVITMLLVIGASWGYTSARAWGQLTAIAIVSIATALGISWTWPRPLVYMGVISYSLYLLHWPILVSVGTNSTTATIALWLSLSFGLGWLTYRFVERPAIAIGRRANNHNST